MMDSFGARLRRERERQHISLDDIAARTKIKASLFAELERDDASHWPSGIFRRSFMRAYADALGLDADAVVREFGERFPDPAAPPAVGPAAPAAVAPSAVSSPAAGRPAVAAEPPKDVRPSHTLRLTLVETGLPFTGGRVLADARRRWSAAAWDLGALIATALSIFMFVDSFWMPFGVTALCYYVGGILVLGNSPGVCLFAPKPTDDGGGGPKPSRVPRHRPVDTSAARPAEPAFRATRFRADRQREVRG
jgi:transcriptional regulator with XRE-family HTH domain